MGHILRLGPLIPGGREVVSAALALYRNISAPLGYMPGFDVGCSGPYNLLGLINRGVPPYDPAVANMTRGLLNLRVADGGWVNLDYSRANQSDGTPYTLATAEVTAPAILALRRAGLPLDDPAIRGAIRAMDDSILRDAYRETYPHDYLLGADLALMAYQKNGISSIEAFRKARDDVARNILAVHNDSNHLYVVAHGLLGLQGFLPEKSEPYRAGLRAVLGAYDPPNHTWRANDSSVFGSGFFNTTSYNIAPLMVLHRKGYGGDYLDPVTAPAPPACPRPEVMVSDASEGLRLRVRAPGASEASADYTTDGYRTLQNATLAPREGGWFSGTIPAAEFQVALKCGERFDLTPWFSASWR
jgi:hypothetical protein